MVKIAAFILSALSTSGVLAIASLPALAQDTPRTVTYECDDDRSFSVNYMGNGMAQMTLGNQNLELRRIPAGSGTQYSNGAVTLFTQGDEAYVAAGDRRILNDCVAQGNATETEAATTEATTETATESGTTERTTGTTGTTGVTVTETEVQRTTRPQSTVEVQRTEVQRTQVQTTTPAPAPEPAPEPAAEAAPAPVRALW